MDLVQLIICLVLTIMLMLTGTSPANAKGKDHEVSMTELSSREEVVKLAGYGEDSLSTVVIAGKLLCNAPSHHKLWRSISGAAVAVFCGTSGRTKKSLAKGTTNSYGGFQIDLPSHLHAIPNLEKICLVKVLHLPKSCSCRHTFTGKHKGIKLTSIGEGIRIYTTRTIHLMAKPSQEHAQDGAKMGHTASVL